VTPPAISSARRGGPSGGWVIEQVAPDFDVLDVWELPVHGGADDLDDLVRVMAALDPRTLPRVVAALFAVRHRLGAVLGWDDPAARRPIPGRTETTLRERLPAALRDGRTDAGVGPALAQGGFALLYRTANEWAAEISNATVHGVLHLRWVDRGSGRYGGELAVYVKPRGALGRAYLALIGPARHLLVYPALLRAVARAWDDR
jgi:hypothetical protein